MLAPGVLVAFDDVFLGNFLKAAVRLDALHVADRFTARRMDHAKRDVRLRRKRGVKLHRNKDERQAKIARPKGLSHLRHTRTLVIRESPNLVRITQRTRAEDAQSRRICADLTSVPSSFS